MTDHANAGYRRLFGSDGLTVGLFLPLSGSGRAAPSMDEEVALARRAADLGFDALWVRDVPTYWPKFGEAGQVYDPWVTLATLAAGVDEVALATGSIVLTVRHPLHVAKAAASIDRLSGGRLVLGVGSGDRPPEFAAFGVDEDERGQRFREHVRVLRAVWSAEFPTVETGYGELDGTVDLVPKPTTETLPLLVTGNARQSVDWIAEHGDGWLHYNLPTDTLAGFLGDWRDAGGGDKPFAQGLGIQLDPDPSAGMEHIRGGYAAGSEWVVSHLRERRDLGVDHVALGLRVREGGDVRAAMERFADEVLPAFG